MEEHTLTKVFRADKNRQGLPLVTKAGKPYTRIAIQVPAHKEKWISGFGNSRNANWKAGDVVRIEIEPNGQYLNFSMPNQMDEMQNEINWLKQQMETMEIKIEKLRQPKSDVESSFQPDPAEQVNVEDIPF